MATRPDPTLTKRSSRTAALCAAFALLMVGVAFASAIVPLSLR